MQLQIRVCPVMLVRKRFQAFENLLCLSVKRTEAGLLLAILYSTHIAIKHLVTSELDITAADKNARNMTALQVLPEIVRRVHMLLPPDWDWRGSAVLPQASGHAGQAFWQPCFSPVRNVLVGLLATLARRAGGNLFPRHALGLSSLYEGHNTVFVAAVSKIACLSMLLSCRDLVLRIQSLLKNISQISLRCFFD